MRGGSANAAAFLVDVPLTRRNAGAHFEASHVLALLQAGELFGGAASAPLAVLDADAARLVRVLLDSYARHAHTPGALAVLDPASLPSAPSDAGAGGEGGGLLGAAFALADRWWSGGESGAVHAAVRAPSMRDASGGSVADAAAMLLLVSARHESVFRALTELDSERMWRALFARFAAQPFDEPAQLLLFLLCRNDSFVEHVLARVDVDQLVEPMLRVLHACASVSSATHQQCVLLDCLVTLTSHTTFFASIDAIELEHVAWFDTHDLRNCSLGSLLLLVVLQLVHRNLAQYRDEELHVLARAVLLNVADSVEHLHAVTAEKLVRLVSTLCRKMAQVDERAAEQRGAYEDVLRTLLHVANCALFDTASHNPCLVFALLGAPKAFEALREHAQLGTEASRTLRAIRYFDKALASTGNAGGDEAARTIRALIDDAFDSTGADAGPLHKVASERRRALLRGSDLIARTRFVAERRPKTFATLAWNVFLRWSVLVPALDKVTLFDPTSDLLEAK